MENKKLKDELFRDYEIKRADALEKKNIKTKEAYEKVPELKEIDDEINNLGLLGMRKILDKSQSQSEFTKSMNVLIKKREKLIKDNKIDPDYNKPSYECSVCNDTGYDQNNELCQCFIKKLTMIEYENSQLGKMLEDADFDNFKLSYYDDKETITQAKEETLAFCKNFDNISYNLFFYGQ